MEFSLYFTKTFFCYLVPHTHIKFASAHPVPDWLAKEAEKAPGGAGATKGFGGSFGNFGGSDIRKNEMKTVHHAALEESDDDDWD